jgi:hypothetical protein
VSAVYDPDAHEPLTDTPWDRARAEASIAAIVADAEAAVVDRAWPNHPLDDEGDLHDGMATVYLGAAGMIWALHTLGSRLDLPPATGRGARPRQLAPAPGEMR